MNDDKMRETRAQLQHELQQIAEHSGEITTDMADRFDALEADIRDLDGKIRAADVRARFESMKAEPVSKRVAPGASVETADAGDEWAAFMPYWRSGGVDKSAIEARDMATTNTSEVVPTVLQAEMARKFADVSGAIQAVRRSQLPQKASVASVSSRVAITNVIGEGLNYPEDDVAFDEIDFSTDQNAAVSTEISMQLIQDSTPDMISEIQLNHAEELGRFWSSKICAGLTVTTSQTDGIFASSSIIPSDNQLDANATTAITAEELINLRYSALPAQYWTGYGDLGFIMNQSTFAHIATLTDDTNGRPLLQPFADSSLSAGFGMALLGVPVYLDAAAPVIATGNTVVALIARNAYRFIERTPGLRTDVNPYAKQRQGLVQINTFQRGVGRFVRPEACATLTMA